jgi:hypothetical protein
VFAGTITLLRLLLVGVCKLLASAVLSGETKGLLSVCVALLSLRRFAVVGGDAILCLGLLRGGGSGWSDVHIESCFGCELETVRRTCASLPCSWHQTRRVQVRIVLPLILADTKSCRKTIITRYCIYAGRVCMSRTVQCRKCLECHVLNTQRRRNHRWLSIASKLLRPMVTKTLLTMLATERLTLIITVIDTNDIRVNLAGLS